MHFILSSIWYIILLPVGILLTAIIVSISLHLNFFRCLIALILPPISVIDKGWDSVIIVLILWILGWIPGVIAAFYILNKDNKRRKNSAIGMSDADEADYEHLD